MQHPERVQAIREFSFILSKKRQKMNLGVLLLALGLAALLKIIHLNLF